MIKNICNSELFVPKKPFKYNIIVAVFMVVAVLPLPVMAEGEDKPLIEKVDKKNPNPEITVEKDRATIQDTNKENSPTITESYAVDAKSNTANESSEPIDKNVINNSTGSNNAAASTAALDNIDGLNSDNTEEKISEKKLEEVKKVPFWKDPKYLLPSGLLLLILGSVLLVVRKISSLNDENRELTQNYRMLKGENNSIAIKLKQFHADNEKLKADLKHQLDIRDAQNNISSEDFGAVLPLMDTEELLMTEDLDASDRKQLSDSITTWFQKNRGNMNIRDLVSVEIQKKLDHWQYSIEIWVGSDGVDSVELASDTKRAAVISLTKPDRQGFAYCYKKPNSLSNVWDNKAWYKAQRTERTLEVIGKLLESN